jgi:hypothetical protein
LKFNKKLKKSLKKFEDYNHIFPVYSIYYSKSSLIFFTEYEPQLQGLTLQEMYEQYEKNKVIRGHSPRFLEDIRIKNEPEDDRSS